MAVITGKAFIPILGNCYEIHFGGKYSDPYRQT